MTKIPYKVLQAGISEYFRWKDSHDSSPSNLVSAIIAKTTGKHSTDKERYIAKLVRRAIKDMAKQEYDQIGNILNEILEELTKED